MFYDFDSPAFQPLGGLATAGTTEYCCCCTPAMIHIYSMHVHIYTSRRVCCARTNIDLDYSTGSRCEYTLLTRVWIYICTAVRTDVARARLSARCSSLHTRICSLINACMLHDHMLSSKPNANDKVLIQAKGDVRANNRIRSLVYR